MLKARYFLMFMVAVTFCTSTIAQVNLEEIKNVNTPYSDYGIGIPEQSGFIQNRAMGGLSTGLRLPGSINYLNPASYNAQDTNTFIFDAGINGLYNKINTQNQSVSNSIYNINHLAINFFITKKWYGSVGLVPYSNVGYQYNNSDTSALLKTMGINYANSVNKGSGGLSKFYIGNSVEVIKDKLNIGLNLSYIFGSIHKTALVESEYENSTSQSSSYTRQFTTYNDMRYNVSDLTLNLGLQYKVKLNAEKSIIIGAVYDFGADLNTQITHVGFNSKNDTIYNKLSNSYIRLPSRISIGATYINSDMFLIGTDLIYQNYSIMRFGNQKLNLTDTYKAIVGMQYTPNSKSLRSYVQRVSYRAGAYYGNTPIKIGNTQINDYGVSIGLGIPYRASKSAFNVSFEMGVRGVTTNTTIQESYKRITLSLTLQDYWFYKRKFD